MSTKTDERTKRTVMISLMTAIVIVTTMFVAIPIPNITGAYINAGDAAVYACAFILGGPWGAACAGVGSAIADLLVGSAIYAPATLIIKGLMALTAGALMKRMNGKKVWLALIAAGLVMPVGYFLYECILVGIAAAAAGILFNLIQYAGGVLLGILLIKGLDVLARKEK